MLYIITYISDNNNSIIETNTDNNIIKLSGNNKIDSIIDFCKTKNSNDIICYVNDLDIIIADNKEILDKYYSFNTELIILSPALAFEIKEGNLITLASLTSVTF